MNGGLWSLAQNVGPCDVFPELLQHRPGEQEWLMQVLFVSRSRNVPVCVCLCGQQEGGTG